MKFITGKINNLNVVIAQSGVGKVNASVTTTLILDHFQPEQLIFTGIAGGINPALQPGDIVIGSQTAQHDYGTQNQQEFLSQSTKSPLKRERNPFFFPPDARLLRLAENAKNTAKLNPIKTIQGEHIPKIITGTIVTGDMFVASESKSKELHQKYQADAVEMEGAAVAQVCWQFAVPCIIIRSISDNANAIAREDMDVFYRIAAENSAKFVLCILQQFSVAQSIIDEK